MANTGSRGPRTPSTARGNRRLRGLGQIRGRLPPTGLPGGEITKHTKESTREHEARRGTQSQRTQRPQRVRGRGPRRTARGNRRLRGLGQIRGRLPPTGLPGGEITKGTKGDTEEHEGGWGTITKNTVSLKGEPSTATGTKGARAGPRRTGWTARGNRRLRGLGQILGRLPPTGLPRGRSLSARRGTGRGTKGNGKKHNGQRGRGRRGR